MESYAIDMGDFEIENLRRDINELKPQYDEYNKKLRLSKTERIDKARLGTRLYELNIKLIHELIKKDLKIDE